MGELNSFHINDDGSVTVEQQLTEQEQNILDIFKIEKSKGGTFASRRMKNRAIKYAKSANYPEFKVDKLMLDNYPDDFANYPKTTTLIVWLIIGITFLCGAITFAFPTYFEFERVSYYNEQIDACEEYLSTGDVEKYCYNRGVGREIGGNYSIPMEEVERSLTDFKQYRNYNLKYMLWYLSALFGSLAISYISLRQYRRIARQLKPIKNTNHKI